MLAYELIINYIALNHRHYIEYSYSGSTMLGSSMGVPAASAGVDGHKPSDSGSDTGVVPSAKRSLASSRYAPHMGSLVLAVW